MRLAHTRSLVSSALSGDLDDVPYALDPVFNVSVPERAPGVPSEILRPRDTWSDTAAFDTQAAALAGMFNENFARFATGAPSEVSMAGPRAG